MLGGMIETFKRNPILSSLWTLWTACFFFLCHEEYTSAQQIAALRVAAVQVEHKQNELTIVQKATALHDEALDSESIKPPANLKQDLQRDRIAATNQLIAKLAEQHGKLQQARIVLAGLYLENDALKQLRDGLVKDLEEVDADLEERTALIRVAAMEPPSEESLLALAQQLTASRKRMMEGEARFAAAEHIFNRVRQEYNAAAATYNAERRMYDMRSKLRVAAWLYLGGFIGALGGYFLSRRRRDRSKAGTSDTSQVPSTEGNL
jgi:hypothetical protein